MSVKKSYQGHSVIECFPQRETSIVYTYTHNPEIWGRECVMCARMVRIYLLLLVHVLQAREDHHTVGEATLHQEMERIPYGKTDKINKLLICTLTLKLWG